jgi:shikimate dehydrogenase
MEIVKSITGKTKIIGVIGNPVEHSISPQLHNTLSRYLGLDLVYIPMRPEKDQLENAVKGLKAINITGFNVTIPFKNDIIKYLDECSEEATLMGAVNTVKNLDGRLYGYNTDAEGFSCSFKMESDTGFEGKTVAVLGAGGASRAIAVKVAMEKASKVFILNRTLPGACEIAELINRSFSCTASASGLNSPEAAGILKRSDIIINTTPLGMYPHPDDSPLPEFDGFRKSQIIYDTIYNPPMTKFLAAASQKGCKTINGFGMLIFQGILAYEMWTGIKVPDDTVCRLFETFVKYLEN